MESLKMFRSVGPGLCRPRLPCPRPSKSSPGGHGFRSRATYSIDASGGGRSGGGDYFDDGSGGYGGDGEGGGDQPQEGILWKGWYDRVQADPGFPAKVFIEQIIGVGAAVLGDMAGRDNWGLYELDFVFSTLVVGSILNFSLMYLLAATPPSTAGAASSNLIQKMFSEQTLKSIGAPGGHMFEAGYSPLMRAANLFYKGFIFTFVGFGAGLVGTAASNTLLFLRRKIDPGFELQNKPPHVLYNSLTWSCHMGISANLRYQFLYGMDMVLSPLMPAQLFLTYSAVIRTLNNILGGTSFVFFAKLFGVQKSTQEIEKKKQN